MQASSCQAAGEVIPVELDSAAWVSSLDVLCMRLHRPPLELAVRFCACAPDHESRHQLQFAERLSRQKLSKVELKFAKLCLIEQSLGSMNKQQP